MTEIEALYENYESETKSKSHKDYIDFYEANKAVIEGGDTSTWSVDAIYITNMTSGYALSLSYYGSSRKSLPYLDKAIELFENLNENDFLSKDNSCETLRWIRGKENHNQKNYIDAAKDFTYLVEHYPDNDIYKNWLKSSLTNRTEQLNNFAWVGAGITFAIGTFTKKVDLLTSFLFDICSVIFLIIIVFLAVRNYLIKSKIK